MTNEANSRQFRGKSGPKDRHFISLLSTSAVYKDLEKGDDENWFQIACDLDDQRRQLDSSSTQLMIGPDDQNVTTDSGVTSHETSTEENHLAELSSRKPGFSFAFGFSPLTRADSSFRQSQITASLGATMGGHELSWSSSMATPMLSHLKDDYSTKTAVCETPGINETVVDVKSSKMPKKVLFNEDSTLIDCDNAYRMDEIMTSTPNDTLIFAEKCLKTEAKVPPESVELESDSGKQNGMNGNPNDNISRIRDSHIALPGDVACLNQTECDLTVQPLEKNEVTEMGAESLKEESFQEFDSAILRAIECAELTLECLKSMEASSLPQGTCDNKINPNRPENDFSAPEVPLADCGIDKAADNDNFNVLRTSTEQSPAVIPQTFDEVKNVKASTTMKSSFRSGEIQKKFIGITGFSTANRKQIHVSAAALEYAKKRFYDSEEDFTVPSYCLDISDSVLRENRPNVYKNEDTSSGFNEFSTASVIGGNNLADAVDVACEINRTNEQPNHPPILAPKVSEISANSGKNVEMLQKDSCLSQSLWNGDEFTIQEVPTVNLNPLMISSDSTLATLPKFSLFTTAAGKSINISEESLKKARTLFNDGVELQKVPNERSNTTVKISDNLIRDNSMTFSKKQFPIKDTVFVEPGGNGGTDVQPKFIGFTTAKGAPVAISESSLIKATDLWKSTEERSPMKPAQDPNIVLKSSGLEFKGFSTAGGRNVTVSESAMENARMRMAEVESETNVFNLDNTLTPNWRISNTSVGRRRIFSNFSKQKGNNKAKVTLSEVSGANSVTTDDKLENSRTDDTCLKALDFSSDLSNEIFESMAAFIDDEEQPKRKSSEESGKKRPCMNSVEMNSRKKICLPSVSFEASSDTMELKNNARDSQSQRISHKRSSRVCPVYGIRWQQKHQNKQNRVSLLGMTNGEIPKRLPIATLRKLGVKDSVLCVCSRNSLKYKFKKDEITCDKSSISISVGDGTLLIFSNDDMLGVDEICRGFLDTNGIDPKLISKEWIRNHYRWIVWKLAAMEISFPERFAGWLLTPDEVVRQLHYRYNCEIDQGQRSTLKKIFERDDTPAKTMVLCVAAVCAAGICEEQPDETNDADGVLNPLLNLELSDGWYSIKAVLDDPLFNLVLMKKIFVGLKLVMHGAELTGSREACAPLEAPKNLALKICSNGCRRARWNTKLGFQRFHCPFPLPLTSLWPSGGVVGRVDLLIARVYPLQYLERKADGSTLILNEKQNSEASYRYEIDRSSIMEKILTEVQGRIDGQLALAEIKENRNSSLAIKQFTPNVIKSLKTGEEISKALTSAADPEFIESCLSGTQCTEFINYKGKLSELRTQLINKEVEKALQLEKTNPQSFEERNVVPFMKVRAVGLSEKDLEKKTNCLITIWRPSFDLKNILNERMSLSAYYLAAEASRKGADRCLKSTKLTKFEPKAPFTDDQRIAFASRKITFFSGLLATDFVPLFGEVDIVGVVHRIGQQEQSRFDNVYLADSRSDFVIVKFWGGLKAFGVAEIMKPGNAVVAYNLQWRGRTRSLLQCLYAAEFSVFTQKPKEPEYRTEFQNPALIASLEKSQQKLAQMLIPNDANDIQMFKPLCWSTPILKERSIYHHSSERPRIVDEKLQKLQMYESPPSLPQYFSPVVRPKHLKFRPPLIDKKEENISKTS